MLMKLICATLTAMTLMIASTADSMADTRAATEDGIDISSATGKGNAGGKGKGKDSGSENCGIGESEEDMSEYALAPDEIDSLLFMREEEKLARDTYLVLGELWGLVIFDNIANSEQNHMDAIKVLIDCYGLTDPVMQEIGAFSDPALQALFDYLISQGMKSPMDGLYVGAAIEETDIEDIQHAIDVSDHENIVSTYESLMCGSRNHLRAFIRQIEINGGSYTPSVLDAEEFWEIAYSDMEQDCGSY
jgi:hypothetical protein